MFIDRIREKYGIFASYSMVCVAVALVFYAGYKIGWQTQHKQQQTLLSTQQTITALLAENEALVTKANSMSVELEMLRANREKAQQKIQTLLSNEAHLHQKLAIYQRVMAPEMQPEGFYIDAFKVTNSSHQGLYNFELILLQTHQIKSVFTGNLLVEIEGTKEGKRQRVKLHELIPEQNSEFKFRFKYFQVIKGSFALPQQFTPQKVIVKAQVYKFKRKHSDVEQNFDWVLDQVN